MFFINFLLCRVFKEIFTYNPIYFEIKYLRINNLIKLNDFIFNIEYFKKRDNNIGNFQFLIFKFKYKN